MGSHWKLVFILYSSWDIETNSLNFVVQRILFKVFRNNSDDIVQGCQLYFNFPDMSVLLTARKKQFLMKFSVSDNCLCSQFISTAITDLQQLVQLVPLSVQCTCNYLLQLGNYCMRLSTVLRWIKIYILLGSILRPPLATYIWKNVET